MINKVLFMFMTFSFIFAETASINGKVQYEGKVPRAKKLNMAADPICGKAHTEPVFNESFLVNGDQFMENVIVWIDSPKHSSEVPSEPVVLDQVGCKYVPHVT